MPLSNADKSLGNGQSWQDVGASRAVSTVYTNTTGRTIEVFMHVTSSTTGADGSIVINGIVKKVVGHVSVADRQAFSFLVKHNETYEFRVVAGTVAFTVWLELR